MSAERSGLKGVMTLAQGGVGCQFRIRRLSGDVGLCGRLRSRGFCERMQVKKLACGRNIICGVCGTRVALSRELAGCIEVEQVA